MSSHDRRDYDGPSEPPYLPDLPPIPTKTEYGQPGDPVWSNKTRDLENADKQAVGQGALVGTPTISPEFTRGYALGLATGKQRTLKQMTEILDALINNQ